MKKEVLYACLFSLIAAPALAAGGSSSSSDAYGSDPSASATTQDPLQSQGGGMAEGSGTLESSSLTFEQLDTDSDGFISREEAISSGIVEDPGAVGGGEAGGMSDDTMSDDTMSDDSMSGGTMDDSMGGGSAGGSMEEPTDDTMRGGATDDAMGGGY